MIILLYLPNVALCCVDTLQPMISLQAMNRSMTGIVFGDALLFSRRDPAVIEYANSFGIRVVESGEINSIERYSEFILKDLGANINHDFILVVQWDGFVTHPENWSNEFLQYDYIGAIWPNGMSVNQVGNGGFSLRSRKLLDALCKSDIVLSHPEDLCICDVNRGLLEEKYKISFAPPEVASGFSYEHVRPLVPSFGFHGTFNLIEALAQKEILNLIDSLDQKIMLTTGMRKLAKNLIRDGQYLAAEKILLGRVGSGDREWRTLSLLLRLYLRRTIRYPRGRVITDLIE